MQDHHRAERRQKWARLRFSIVGPLLASPPERGELASAIEELARKTWRHPETGAPIQFGSSTIERWYYAARSASSDPIGSLRNRARSDRGRRPSMDAQVASALQTQYAAHPSWSYKLHADNLRALAEMQDFGPVPSLSTIRRWMKESGLFRRRRRGSKTTEGARIAEERFEGREVRSYEATHVHALWHLDFHHGSRRVLLPEGRYAKAILLAILDDRSRLCCHAQWYLAETVEVLVHGFMQALQKRGLPRMLMTDNGAAMRAEEMQAGLVDLGISWQPTLCYSPHQNGKQEVFWSSVEGRLLAMLEGVPDLTLELLNEATQAWVEQDYNAKLHSELGKTPIERALEGPNVDRPCPSPSDVVRAFRQVVVRRQRRSDGTILVGNVRFEVPSRFGHVERVTVRYARWDLSSVDLWDPAERVVLARLRPLDKEGNADGRRRNRAVGRALAVECSSASDGIAPLLQRMMDAMKERGLPPAYLPGPGTQPDDEASSAGEETGA